MKNYIFILIALLSSQVFSQETYSSLISKAEKLIEEDKKELALDYYTKAFNLHKDSINSFDLYDAAELSNEVNQATQCFDFLEKLVKKNSKPFPGWYFILDKDSRIKFKNLLKDNRWLNLVETSNKISKKFYDSIQLTNDEFFRTKKSSNVDINDKEKFYKSLRNSSSYLSKKEQNYSIFFPINDTLKSSYFIHLPKNYNPNKKYTMLIFLHGAVNYNELRTFSTDDNLKGWNKFYTKYANKHDVILVFPQADKNYNWLTSDKGFYMIPEIIRQIKSTINVDDNKVFLTGHSNGASGSFNYLVKQPTSFAGFYGFNTQPIVRTGGTFIQNILNRSYINFSTDLDYYFPPQANDDLTALMQSLHIDYKDYRYNGYPHWFPEFNGSEPAHKILFDDLLNRKRNPFPNKLIWETDDVKYGKVDWIEITKLDTISPKKEWQKNYNFKITKWLEYDDNDSLQVKDVDKIAFNFPRKSGQIKANYSKNRFNIETSSVKSFRLYITPEMINLNKKLKVYANNKLIYNQKVDYNPSFMKENFNKNMDKVQLWINYIDFEL
ncbi:alpha/beta hydrolase-fold protein [Empedobacter falsenii]|uniref:alpha/beta hydrolase-fold protein n=1 Tax=Empedobacter sp. GD03797 TaxID=2975382 RepID=UPI00244D138E|nr:alpha/beta hydrolase-fold protein [Empedobacter sp. GD03797]MDH1881315.1 esterase family protein [Empedobacter sp. GD03797]